MTEDPRIRYILFKYATGVLQESSYAVAALSLHTHPDGTGQLKVYTLPNWEETVTSDDYLDLAKEILADWGNIPPADALPTFNELENIFNGPLRSFESGACSQPEFVVILKQAFDAERTLDVGRP